MTDTSWICSWKIDLVPQNLITSLPMKFSSCLMTTTVSNRDFTQSSTKIGILISTMWLLTLQQHPLPLHQPTSSPDSVKIDTWCLKTRLTEAWFATTLHSTHLRWHDTWTIMKIFVCLAWERARQHLSHFQKIWIKRSYSRSRASSWWWSMILEANIIWKTNSNTSWISRRTMYACRPQVTFLWTARLLRTST